MKLFHKLLVAPATLGLLAPFSAVANEINVNEITRYGLDQEELIEQEFDSNTFSRELAQTKSVRTDDSISNSNFEAGSFSETTVASFSADFLVSGLDGEDSLDEDEAIQANYSFEIGLNTTFTGEDDLLVVLGSGNTPAASTLTALTLDFGNANSDALKVKDVHYTRTFGEKLTVSVGDSMDVSKQYAGACAYSGFTDVISDCGTGNSAGAAGDVSLSASYDIGNGFTFATGASGSSTTSGIFTKESNDIYGAQLAYAADNYGASISYADSDTSTTDTTYWGLNAYYTFDNAFLDSISAGYEAGNPTSGDDTTGFFVGLTSSEVGPGAFSLGMATSDFDNATTLFADNAEELYIYEVAYDWSVNDSTTVTIGGFIQERAASVGTDISGIAVKTSFAF